MKKTNLILFVLTLMSSVCFGQWTTSPDGTTVGVTGKKIIINNETKQTTGADLDIRRLGSTGFPTISLNFDEERPFRWEMQNQGYFFVLNHAESGVYKTPPFKINPYGNAAFQGTIQCKAIKVTATPTADFVFEEDYNLRSLEEVEVFVKENKHLPEIASAKEMEENGLNINEFQIQLLQKIEELTLYSIQQKKELQEKDVLILELARRLGALEAKIGN